MMDKKIALIAVCSVLFAGCQHNRDLEQRLGEEQRRAAREECEAARIATINKLWVDYEKCVQPKLRMIFLNIGNGYMDIFDLVQAKSMLIASKLDAKKITPEEADVEKAEVLMWANSEDARRAQIDYSNERLHRREVIEQFNRNRSTTTNCYKGLDGSISCTTR